MLLCLGIIQYLNLFIDHTSQALTQLVLPPFDAVPHSPLLSGLKPPPQRNKNKYVMNCNEIVCSPSLGPYVRNYVTLGFVPQFYGSWIIPGPVPTRMCLFLGGVFDELEHVPS